MIWLYFVFGFALFMALIMALVFFDPKPVRAAQGAREREVVVVAPMEKEQHPDDF